MFILIIKKIILFCLTIIFLFLFKTKLSFLNEKTHNYNINNRGYKSSKFAILRRINCPECGLFSNFIVHLGCIKKYLELGYIPIIDLSSFENVFNGFKLNSLIDNPWEKFFYQPFNYTLYDVKQKGRKIKIFECESNYSPPSSIYYNLTLRDYWHNFEKTYMPIKLNILNL